MTTHTRAHKDALLVPKHHYSCHLPGQVLHDGFLLDAWSLESLERKSKEAKALATELPVTGSFCKQILVQLLCNQMHSDKLAMGALETPQHLDSMTVKGRGIRTKFGTISKGNVGCMALLLSFWKRCIASETDANCTCMCFAKLAYSRRIPMPDHMCEATGWLHASPARLMVLDPLSCLTLRV